MSSEVTRRDHLDFPGFRPKYKFLINWWNHKNVQLMGKKTKIRRCNIFAFWSTWINFLLRCGPIFRHPECEQINDLNVILTPAFNSRFSKSPFWTHISTSPNWLWPTVWFWWNKKGLTTYHSVNRILRRVEVFD